MGGGISTSHSFDTNGNRVLTILNSQIICPNTITLQSTPSNPTDAVSKGYVDNLFNGGSSVVNTNPVTQASLNTAIHNVMLNFQSFLPLSGGTMQGNISVAVAPSSDYNLITRGYLNSQLNNNVIPSSYLITPGSILQVANNGVLAWSSSSGGLYLPISGGTLSGPLILSANPTSSLHAATKQYVDGYTGLNVIPSASTATIGSVLQVTNSGLVWGSSSSSSLPIAGGTMSGNIIMGTGSSITLASNPTVGASGAMQAVPRQYVDALLPSGGLNGQFLMMGTSSAISWNFISPWSGWTTFTPTFSSVNSSVVPTIGASLLINNARYKVIGKDLYIRWDYQANSSSTGITAGTGPYYLALPNSYTPNITVLSQISTTSAYGNVICSESVGQMSWYNNISIGWGATRFSLHICSGNIVGFGGSSINLGVWGGPVQGSYLGFGFSTNPSVLILEACIPIN